MTTEEALVAAIAVLVSAVAEALRLELDRRKRRAGRKRTRHSDRRGPL